MKLHDIFEDIAHDILGKTNKFAAQWSSKGEFKAYLEKEIGRLKKEVKGMATADHRPLDKLVKAHEDALLKLNVREPEIVWSNLSKEVAAITKDMIGGNEKKGESFGEKVDEYSKKLQTALNKRLRQDFNGIKCYELSMSQYLIMDVDDWLELSEDDEHDAEEGAKDYTNVSIDIHWRGGTATIRGSGKLNTQAKYPDAAKMIADKKFDEFMTVFIAQIVDRTMIVVNHTF
jgi:hypothetical protein